MTDSRPAARTAAAANSSIRRRLTRRLLASIVAFAFVSNTALFIYLRQELIEQYDEAISTEARAVASLINSEAHAKDLPQLIADSFPRLHLDTDEGGYLQVWRPDGSVAIRSNSLGEHSLDPPTNLRTRGRIRTFKTDLPDGDGGRAAAMRFEESPSSPVNGWVMLLVEDSTELDKTLLHMTLALLFTAGGMCVLAGALVVHGVRRDLQPLDAFAEAVGALRVETLGFRFDADAQPEELVPIARRMNDLLVRLGNAFDRERRFSGNLAHELRTPIAEMRTMLEVASRWPSDAAGTAKLHHDLLAVTVRTSALLEALLTIIRHQQGHQSIALESTPLRPCISEAWESTATLAADRGMRLALEVDDHMAVRANHTVLVALLTNVLENAVSYGAAGSEISVRATREDERTILKITNTTTDLTAADLARLQEPFWRKDAARADRAHAGLGLALVREYAAAMSCGMSLEMPTESTLTITLAWPQG